MSIHGGNYHGFYLSEGRLFAWGWNYECAFSSEDRGKAVPTPREIVIPGNLKIIKFTDGVSNYTTVVLTEKGLYGQGSGGHYHFGDCKEPIRKTLKPIEFYKNKEVRNYFVEGWCLWVLLRKNKVFRSGLNHYGKLSKSVGKSALSGNTIKIPEELDRAFLSSEKEKVTDVKSSRHSILLTDFGRAYSCGSGDYGETGRGIAKVNKLFSRISTFQKKKVRIDRSAVGYSHSVFVANGGMTYSCGRGRHGQLGHGNNNDCSVPKAINALRNLVIKKVRTGLYFSLFLTTRNTVFGCGENKQYQLGIENSGNINILIPTKVSTSLRIVDIATTWYNSLFVSSEGDVYSCGKNGDGQCGLGRPGIPVKKLTKFAKITVVGEKRSLFSRIPLKLVDLRVIIAD